MQRRTALLTALAAAILVIGGSVAAYALFLRGDNVAPLALPSASPGAVASAAATDAPSAATSAIPATAGGDLAGTWTIGADSIVGYRVRERLANLSADSDAVGRTSQISGEVTIAGADDALQVTAASFSVDMTTITSDRGMRDNRLRSSGIETDAFPTSTFVLTAPVGVPPEAASGAAVEVALTGDLTLHGVTKSVTIPAQAQLQDGKIQIVGSLTFPFSDYAIEAPNIAGFVSVEEEGTLEFLVVLTRA